MQKIENSIFSNVFGDGEKLTMLIETCNPTKENNYSYYKLVIEDPKDSDYLLKVIDEIIFIINKEFDEMSQDLDYYKDPHDGCC